MSREDILNQANLYIKRFNAKEYMPPTEEQKQREVQSGFYSFRFFHRPNGVYASVHIPREIPNVLRDRLRLFIENCPDGGQTFSKNGFCYVTCDHSKPAPMMLELIEAAQHYTVAGGR